MGATAAWGTRGELQRPNVALSRGGRLSEDIEHLQLLLCPCATNDEALPRKSALDAVSAFTPLPPKWQAKLATALDHHRRSETKAAEMIYREVLAAAPACFDALHLLGLALIQRGAVEEGLARLQQAIASDPSQPAAPLSLARALLECGDPVGALAACDRLLAHQPHHAEGWFLRGNALQQDGDHEEAVKSYERALEAQPRFPAALNNQAVSLRSLRQNDQALRVLARALEQQPRYPQAWNNRGLVLLDLQRVAEAIQSFDQALALEECFPAALSNRGTALMSAKRFAEAGDAFERLVAVAPCLGGALGNLIYARRNCCDWRDYQTNVEQLVAAVRRGELVDAPLAFMCASDDARAQLECARIFTAVRYPSRPSSLPRWPYLHDRIRVAYVSGDLGEHAVSHLLAGLIERHDRSRFEVIACSWGRQHDGSMRRRLEATFDRFIDATTLSDSQTALRMRELEVDIAVDLTGHTSGQRSDIFAHRAAPLQVNYLGYPGTSGAPYMDYLVADSSVIPAGEESAYSERIARLPGCYLPNDDRRSIGDAAPARAAVGLPQDGFVFCAFNNPLKITPQVFGIWLEVLHGVPGSVLWLRAAAPEARVNLERTAARSGIDPARLVFAPTVDSMERHLARQRCADLFLDTLPYNGHATAIDALWAGLPVLTCRGGSFASRVGASLVAAAGLPELITDNLKDYAALALAVAHDPARLARLSERLEHGRRMRLLFDTQRYCRSLERVYTAMYERLRAGLPPDDLAPDEVGD